MTLNDLTLTGGTIGLYSHNASTNLAASHVSAVANSQDGIRLDTGSSALGLDHLRADQNSGSGIWIDGLLGSLSDSVISNNLSTGVRLNNTGAVRVEANEVFNNAGSGGIQATNTLTGSPLVIGNADLLIGRGNRIHNNSNAGVAATGNVDVVGNTIYGHAGSTGKGISLITNATATHNVAFSNGVGIYSNSGQITENRIYHNTSSGILLDGSPVVSGNIVYSNPYGIQGQFASVGTLIGNILYANSIAGVTVVTAGYYGGTTTLANNTIYQPIGDGVQVTAGSTNVHLRNNIVWTNSGYGLNVANDSQVGFLSDFNDLYVEGTGNIALWQNIARPSLAVWRNTAFTDTNSISTNPLFVDADGADNMLGFVTTTVDGRDDDFHLRSATVAFIQSHWHRLRAAMEPAFPLSSPQSATRQSTASHHHSLIAATHQTPLRQSHCPTAATLIWAPMATRFKLQRVLPAT